MFDVFLMEPAATYKKRHLAHRVMPIGSKPVPSLEDVKSRLKEVRNDSVNHRKKLTARFISSIRQKKNVELFIADTSDLAAEKVKEISRDYPLVVNKSAVISNELKSSIQSKGLIVAESYYEEFKDFENRFNDFRMLPKVAFDAIWDSLNAPKGLIPYRQKNARVHGYGRYTGLVGVNAASAEDGAVVLLQHMNNIRTIVTQAEKIILVVSLDKIVRNYRDALFQTKCMAAFGVESLPLTLNKPEKKAIKFKDLPLCVAGQTANTIHVILLDNDRSHLLEQEERDLLTCIGCRACLRVCPASAFFSSETRLSPRDYIYSFLSGSIPSVGKCIQCRSCRTVCPLEIDIPGFIREARIRNNDRHRPVADRLLAKADFFEKIGSVAPNASKVAYDNKLLRWAGEKITGISRKRNIPKVQRIHLEKWLNESEDSDANGQ